MIRKPALVGLMKLAVGFCAAGSLFASSCSSGLGAIVAGLDAATDYLNDDSQDDNISFGDWLRDELEDF